MNSATDEIDGLLFPADCAALHYEHHVHLSCPPSPRALQRRAHKPYAECFSPAQRVTGPALKLYLDCPAGRLFLIFSSS